MPMPPGRRTPRRTAPALLAVAAALAAGSCGVAPVPTAPAPAPAAEAVRVDGWERLDRSVVPRHYALDLTVDPRTEGFSGRVEIAVELAAPTDRIRMHAEGLDVDEAFVRSGAVTAAATPVAGIHGGLGLRLDRTLPVGPARIVLAFQGRFAGVSHGLYRVEDRGRWYAFTQFQPLSARSAFPCFDQPEFKTPFQVTLHVPAPMQAVSSGPMVSRVSHGGRRSYRFAETQPIPTYLLAMAVGGFETVPVPTGALAGPRMRVITPHGRAGLAAFAARRTPPLLDWLVGWFGRPLPYAKLDQIAVPDFTFGAMENVGLVAYREARLLVDPAHATLRDRMWTEITIAHELSHMWFGNWVTPPWWDDLWLNESFASWMQTKAVDAVSPQLEAGLAAAAHTQYVLYLDSKRDARAVRQPVDDGGDVYNAFDGITYGKGAAVLRMVEAWIGEARFRDGVRAYLADHAHGSGGTPELLAALDRAAEEPVSTVVHDFVDRPGAPLLEAELDCEARSLWPATLSLSQRRYLPAGREDAAAEPWHVPVCVRWGSPAGNGHGGSDRACFLLSERRRTVPLPTQRCPAWVHPNAGERGYYRWSLPEADLLALADAHRGALTLREKLALPGSLRALLEAGEIGVAGYLEALLDLSEERHRRIVEAIVPGLAGLARLLDGAGASEPVHTDLAAYVQRVLGPHLDRIGLVPPAAEPAEATLLRARLIPILADLGRDEAVRARARNVAEAFLAGDRTADGETLRVLLPVASRDAGPLHWERLRLALEASESPALRQTLVRALASFEDPALVERTLGLVLDGTLRASDWGAALGAVRRPVRPAAWRWITRHHDALVERLGPMRAARLPQVASTFCSRERHEAVAAFFRRATPVPGLERNLALALEDVERCLHARERVEGPLRDWLAGFARPASDGA